MQNIGNKSKVRNHKEGRFDNHVVANSISVELANLFKAHGFDEQNVIGGDSRVRMQRLWSKKSATLQEADTCFEKCHFYIKQDKNFIGYIEEEVISADESILNSPLNEDAWDTLLPKLNPRPCPEEIIKECDIHLALHNINPKIDQKLLESGFYYLDFHKPSLGIVRVYTMQTQKQKRGRNLFLELKKILSQGGGVEGFIKFEITRNLYNQGFILPPIILD